jgi:hypothetical protein
MRADPAVGPACVNCHNALESRPQTVANRARAGVPVGKVFEVNRLMGAIEVQLPLDRVAAMARDHSQMALLSVLLLGIGGMLCIGYFVYADVSRARALNHELAWQASHDALTGPHQPPPLRAQARARRSRTHRSTRAAMRSCSSTSTSSRW